MERGDNPERRIAAIVQYDGTNFNGWQAQGSGRTVQQEIERAIHILIKEECRISCSGRTDTGVHAIGQVIHFNISSTINLQRLCIGLNGILAKDVSIINAFHVNNSFHSRFSAVEREYKYLIHNNPQRSPFMKNRAMWVKDELDINYLQKTADYLEGEKDFASFCKKSSAVEKTVRRIVSLSFIRKGDIIEFTIRGNAFLHNMIRIIIGTLIFMHKTGKEPAYMLQILDKKDRDFSGKTAPPCGLYLSKVKFNYDFTENESAFQIKHDNI